MIKLIKRIVLIFVCGLVFCECYSQNPLVKQWDYRFGGNQDDYFTCIIATNDGGSIIGGYSGSPVSGDKSEPLWGGSDWDFWIIKTDALGNKEWDKDYGGTSLEQLFSIQQTKDGGYILAGNTGSDSSGDKSSHLYGYYDYWLLKIDSLGVKQWDNDFGGTDEEELTEVQQTADGGYILGGISYSGIGGNKTQPNWDPSGTTVDYWIVKTDSLGNKLWDKDIGGTDDDYFYSLQQTPGGGYIIGGFSQSGISGNKTHINHGGLDIWLVKLDSAGSILWDKVLGGIYQDYLSSIKVTPDGGFIIGGSSDTQINGDKSQVTCAGIPDDDYWIVKTDSLGNKQWDKDFGGLDLEYFDYNGGNIFLTSDGGYMYSATSYSPVSCDKTEPNLAPGQNWTVKMDSTGNLQWNKTARLPDNLQWYTCAHAVQAQDGCYILANCSTMSAGGDKTQTGQGGYDYWFAKYCDTTITYVHNPQSSAFNLQLFPNPTTGTIQLTINTKHNAPLHCEIINIMGEKVFEKKLEVGGWKLETTLDVSFFGKGIYLVRVGDGERWENRKLVVE